MTLNRALRFCGLLVLCLHTLGFAGTTKAVAGDLKFHTVLIWGTNDDKPNDPNIRSVDAPLQEKLKKIFKWKNYFEVKKETLTVPKDGTNKVKLSDKCEVEIQDLGNSMTEIRLFGQGKLVKKVKQAITPEELVLAGDDKNDSAWFVVVASKTK